MPRAVSNHLQTSKMKSYTDQTILICEANPILAEGILKLLQADSFLSQLKITTQEKFVPKEFTDVLPDILIVDPWQSRVSWQSALSAFRDISKFISVICYCPDITAAEARVIRSVGFRGIMPKTISGDELTRIVCSVAIGGIYVHHNYKENFIEPAVTVPNGIPSLPDLTDREVEVLRHVALGRSLKEIAAVLNISTKTVDTYRTRANSKLNLRSRFDIVKYAIQSGWMN